MRNTARLLPLVVARPCVLTVQPTDEIERAARGLKPRAVTRTLGGALEDAGYEAGDLATLVPSVLLAAAVVPALGEEDVEHGSHTYHVHRFSDHMEIWAAEDKLFRVPYLLNADGVRALLCAYRVGHDAGERYGRLLQQADIRDALGVG